MIPLHSCPRDWLGETVVIVASGPSTERVDLRLIHGRRAIAVSHGCRAMPRADVLLFGGQAFAQNGEWRQFEGPLIVMAQQPARDVPHDSRFVHMRRAGAAGLSSDPTCLCGAESSVTLAINYAVHRGVSRIILLGCDGQPGLAGQRRFGSLHPDARDWPQRYAAQEAAMRSQLEPLRQLGVSVVNCSPGTALTCYPTASLEDALAAA